MTARCPQCRTRRASAASLLKHIKLTRHKPCTCGGYHYPHRPGSPCCESNKYAAYYEAERRGESPEDLKRIFEYISTL